MKVSFKRIGLLFFGVCLPASMAAGEDGNVMDLEALSVLAKSLRAGDIDLIRANPSDATAEQQKALCPNSITRLVATVADPEVGLEAQARAAEVLALCTTSNPENREAIGKAFSDGGVKSKVHSGLVDLVHNGRKALDAAKPKREEDEESKEAKVARDAVAYAAEAIWILTFNSPTNHAGFVEAGAVPALAEMLIDPQCEERHICSWPIMWSGGALQNLAANYCDSESGLCWWEWADDDKDDKEEVLRIHEQHGAVKVDAQKVRKEMLHYGDDALVHELLDMICNGPVHLPHHALDEDENYYHAWPTLAEKTTTELEGDEDAPSLVPWAGAGVIKNLALGGPDARELLLNFEHMEECLCDMKHSPDALEAGKAEEALYNLGASECPPLYDESCQDFAEWKDAETQETCKDYEENNWCVEYGHHANVDGVTAIDACCACGGGTEGGDEL